MDARAAIAFTLPSLVTVAVAETKQVKDEQTGQRSEYSVTYAEYKDPRSLCPIFILERLKVLQ